MPERGTRFLVVERNTGKLISQAITDSFFSFHHANAFESGENLIIDLVAFSDLSRMDGIFPQASKMSHKESGSTRLMRYHYSLNKGEVTPEILLEKEMEFPRVDARLDGKPYRYLYCTLSNEAEDLFPRVFMGNISQKANL